MIKLSYSAALRSTAALAFLLAAVASGQDNSATPGGDGQRSHLVGSPAEADAPPAVTPTKDSLETVKKRMAAGKAVLVDVRDPYEWEEGHLRDARHLPMKKVLQGVSEKELQSIAPGDKIIYLHCASGFRSLEAARLLSRSGRDVRSLKPGFEALLKAGFPAAD